MTPLTPHFLIIEDEPAQAEVLRYNLEAEGYTVSWANDAEEGLLLAEEDKPALIVLDWMLPSMSGIEACRQLKASEPTRSIPIIMLTARGEEADRVRGLETGADDYMVKPHSIAELMARVRALLRRSNPAAFEDELTFEDITLNPGTHRVTRASHALKLGPTEFRLLSVFMERPKRVWSREQLLDRVWGHNVYIDDRTVDVHIRRLRKALCADGGRDPIRTVRGAGYALDMDP